MRVARNNFPELLVLGPEQLKVIQESKHHDRILLVGGTGCGKTSILLYMLYKNTAKYLRENNCKMVVFVIPEKKTQLRLLVEVFVEEFCNPNYVYIQSFESFCDFSAPQAGKLILFDEIYTTLLSYSFDEFARVNAKIIVALGLMDGQPYETFPSSIPSEWTTFNLWYSYAIPPNISSLCRKLRQLIDRKLFFSHPIQLDMALNEVLKVNDEDSFQIKHIDCCSEIGKEIEERKETTLLVADDENAFKSEFLNEYTLRVHVNFSAYFFDVQALSFTGVRYAAVVILLTKSTHGNKGFLAKMYHSVSRSIHRVILLTPDPESYKTLLAATPVDLKVFDKLSRYQNVPREDLLLLTNEKEVCEALELTILTENWSMLDSLIETIQSRPEYSTIRKDTIRILLRAFPRFQKGEILNYLSKNFDDTIGIQQMLISYVDSARTISVLPNVPARRRLREMFLTLMPGWDLYTHFFYQTKNNDCPGRACRNILVVVWMHAWKFFSKLSKCTELAWKKFWKLVYNMENSYKLLCKILTEFIRNYFPIFLIIYFTSIK